MTGPLGEPHDLVLDRRAVAWPNRRDLPGIHRRPVEVRADQGVCRRGRFSNGTGDLPRLDAVGQEGEWLRRLVAWLRRQARPIDRASPQAWRRPGLEPAEREVLPVQALRKSDGRRLTDPARGDRFFPHVDQAPQERAGRQDHTARADLLARSELNPGHPAVRANQILNGPRPDGEPRLLAQQCLDRLAVKLAVRLRPWTPDGRTLAPVEHAELNARTVDGPRHDPVQRIDLADEMALAQPAYGRIAGHLADRVQSLRQQQCARADACRRRRRLAPGMAAADHNDIPPRHARQSMNDGPPCQNLSGS